MRADSSSESVHESEIDSDEDERVIYLTSRATSPKETDMETRRERDRRKQREERTKTISRTKTRKSERKIYKRRWDRPKTRNADIQVDEEEIDRNIRLKSRFVGSTSGSYSGRGSSSGYSSKYSGSSSSPSKYQSSYDRGASSYSRNRTESTGSDAAEVEEEKPKLRKKSDGEKKTRPKSGCSDSSHQSSYRSKRETPSQSTFINKREAPPQSSFINKRQSRVCDSPEVSALTSENLSLKDSIDKVRSWKEQLHDDPPDSPMSPVSTRKAMSPVSPMPRKAMSPVSPRKAMSPVSPRKPMSPIPPKKADIEKDKTDIEKTKVVKKKSSKSKSDKKAPKSGIVTGTPIFPLDVPQVIPVVPQGPLSPTKIPQATNTKPENVMSPKAKAKNKHNLRLKIDRTPSPYDNTGGQKRCNSPYDNLRAALNQSPHVLIGHHTPTHTPPQSPRPPRTPRMQSPALQSPHSPRLQSAQSTDSMTAFADISDNDMSRAQSMMSLNSSNASSPRKGNKLLKQTNSMDSLSFSTTSLPDLVPASEARRGTFISGLRDIDSLLEFSDEDEFENRAANDGGVVQQRRARSPLPVHHGPLRIGGGRENRMGGNAVYICDYVDLDDLLGEDPEERFLILGAQTPTEARNMLNLPEPTYITTSSESILDTPVPQTPSIPLEPAQFAFSGIFPERPMSPLIPQAGLSQFQSVDNLSTVQDVQKGGKKKHKKKKKAKRAEKAKSMANLDDLDSLLDTINRAPAKLKKRDSTFDLLTREGKSDLNNIVDAVKNSPRNTPPLFEIQDYDNGNVPTGQLVDLDFQDCLSPTYPTSPEVTVLSSEDAVAKALAIQQNKGHMKIEELLDLCAKPVVIKPPWVEDEEDRHFTGFKSLTELLEDMFVDVQKVSISLFYGVCRMEPLLGIRSWCHTMQRGLCISFEDRAPIYEICRCSIFISVAMA